MIVIVTSTIVEMSFADDLLRNAASIGIAPDAFRPIDSTLLPELVLRCNESFPSIPSFLWWPHSPAQVDTPGMISHQFLDQLGYQRIPSLVSDPSEPIWMFAENWGRTDPRGFDALIAFHTTPFHAHAIIDESHGFEYILVSQSLDWLIAENDHRYLFVAGDFLTDRFKDIVT